MNKNSLDVSSLVNKGLEMQNQQSFEQALTCFEQALLIDSDNSEVLRGKGNVLQDMGRFDEAVCSFEQLLLHKPDDARALNCLGNLFQDLGRFTDAIISYDKSIAINPNIAGVYFNRGNALLSLGRQQEALLGYQRALQLNKDFVEAHLATGNVLHALNRPLEALVSYDRVLQIQPEFAEAFYNRATVLYESGQFEEALVSFDKSLTIQADYFDALHNRGLTLLALNRPVEALESYDRALAHNPGNVELLVNRAIALRSLNRFDEALHDTERALAINPDYAAAHLCESICRLTKGEFAKGWQKYEWRWLESSFKPELRNFIEPLWTGHQSLQGKTILLYAEQGYGDTLQFCRYVKQLQALGATVILEVQAALKSLLIQMEGLCHVQARGEKLPAFDFQCPLMSLPCFLHTELNSIPDTDAYLGCDSERVEYWQNRIGKKNRPRIGLVWSGNPEHRNDVNRSIALIRYLDLLTDKAEFYALQKDVRPADKPVLDTCRAIINIGEQITSFNDSAALIALMDLVITVDTSIAHLAGAMGKTVWVLLPFNPDFRWLLNREDSPWYRSVRLFRQAEIHNWETVLELVNKALVTEIYQAAPGIISARPEAKLDDTMKSSLKNALKNSSADCATLVNAGLELQIANRLDEALALYDQALAIDAEAIEALRNRGDTLHDLGRLQEALTDYEQLLSLCPDDAKALNCKGNILQDLGRYQQACDCYDRALVINPEYAFACFNKGNALVALNRPDAALTAYDRALELLPDFIQAHLARGNLSQEMQRFEDALVSYGNALAIKPDYAEAFYNLGIVYYKLKRFAEALASYDSALELRADWAEVLINRGSVLHVVNRYHEAVESFETVLRNDPDNFDALFNRGRSLQALLRLNESLESYQRALTIAPKHAQTHFHEGMCRLLMGDFDQGWQKFEWQWQQPALINKLPHYYSEPLWTGQESLAGKTILLYTDQGFGDSFQFCRYTGLVARQGAIVIMEVEATLKKLFEPLRAVKAVFTKGEVLPYYDYQCPLGSLPLAFATNLDSIPLAEGYLQGDPNRISLWQNKLGDKTGPRIGLVWSGDPNNSHDHSRSIALSDFLELVNDTASFYALKKDLTEEERLLLERHNVVNAGDAINDFSDTAALIALMDLVISVDTSVAHLAAAMAKPVWVLIAYSPDWRWLLEREDSPWYRSVRLFRQTENADWKTVICAVKNALKVAEQSGFVTLPRVQMSTQPATEVTTKNTTGTISEPQQSYCAIHADKTANDARFVQAIALHQQARLDEAEVLYAQILKADPKHVDALHFSGVLANQRKQHQTAADLIGKALAYDPNSAAILSNLGLVLQELGRFDEALTCFDRALAIKADFAEAYSNRGNVLQALYRMEDALGNYDKAIALKPDYVDALCNRGVVLQALVRMDEALSSYQRALAIDPEHALSHWCEGMCRLKMGDFAIGWQKYQWRWRQQTVAIGTGQYLEPLWTGVESLSNKTLLLYAEQGLGDSVQFCRYTEKLAALGARLIMEVPSTLKTLFQSLSSVSAVYATGVALPAFDYRCPLLDLPFIFHTDLDSIPLADAYLFADSERVQFWQEKLGTKTGIRVGLVWSGGYGQKNIENRSIAFKDFSQILDSRAQYYSLQKDVRTEDLLQISRCKNVEFLGEFINDFADTAAIVKLMDVVISIDTSVAHLAGAMGKPVWIPLLFASDWRWLLETRDSPWYRSALLFRQPNRDNWQAVIADVKQALQAVFDKAAQNPDACINDILHDFQQTAILHTTSAMKDNTENSETDEALLQQADMLIDQGQLLAALVCYDRLLANSPDNARGFYYRGNVLYDLGRPGDAIDSYDRALEIKPDDVPSLFNRANALLLENRLDEALTNYDKILELSPDYVEALIARGNILQDMNRFEDALHCYDQAINYRPDYAECFYNRGLLLQACNRLDEALASFDQVLQIRPDYAQALLVRGNVLLQLRQTDAAITSFDKAIAIDADCAEAFYGKALAFGDSKRFEEALKSYEEALAIKPDYAEAYASLGYLLQRLKLLDAALKNYDLAVAINPEMAFLAGFRLQAKLMACNWEGFDESVRQLQTKIAEGKNASTPFPLMLVSDVPALQKQLTELYAREKYPNNPVLPKLTNPWQHPKIRLAYFSSDFCNHPVTHLTAQLFERHDRERFEITAFSLGENTRDPVRVRLESAFDNFVDASQYSDEQCVKLARSLEIDIAIDLNGFTDRCRTGIFAMRAAPIQVSYIGYLGTMGVDYMDYLIADPVLIPPEYQGCYTEKIVYLPDSFQVNDNQLAISKKVFTRTELFLPEQGFVFCCFNNNFKITPAVFSIWMRLLHSIEGSVLWLLADNVFAVQNLRNEAKERGINPERLVFAERMAMPEYLARHAQADLFLDTFPYNAGATASAALWSGLPVLTCIGNSFPARMGASLLTAIGLPELIANSFEHYESIALELAGDPEKLLRIKAKLKANRPGFPLFDTERFTSRLESAFIIMQERYQSGLNPEHIYVDSKLSEHQKTAEKPKRKSWFSRIFGSKNSTPSVSKLPGQLEIAQTNAAKFQKAIEFHQQQQLTEADSLYREILETQPEHADALHFSGVLANQRGQGQLAVDLISKSIAINPQNAAAHSNIGLAFQSLKQFEQAINSYDRALAIQSDLSNALYNRGNSQLELGRFQDAVASYKRVLIIYPDYADAHYGLGIARQCLKQVDEALECFDKVLELNPDNVQAIYSKASLLHDQNRLEQALSCYDQVLTVDSEHTEALYSKGICLFSLGRFDEAISCYDRAVAVKPDYHEAFTNRGIACQDVNRLEDALDSYDRSIAIKPDYAIAHYNRGIVLYLLKRFDEAIASYQQALSIKPDYVEALTNLGVVYQQLNRLDDALATYNLALAYDPESVANAHYNRGIVLYMQKRFDEAIASYELALSVKPDYVEALTNMGVAFQGLNRLEDALTAYDRSLSIKPFNIESLANKGVVLQSLNRLPEALLCYEQALAHDPACVAAHFSESLTRLLSGDFALGFKKYEWRWEESGSVEKRPDYQMPLWLGQESLTNKSILLYAEQGYGDTLQFARYAPLVAERGATVFLEVQSALKPLLEQLPGVTKVFGKGEILPTFDYHCPLLSLPLAFSTSLDTIPTACKYIDSNPERLGFWQQKLGKKTLPRVGIVWTGNPQHKNDSNRSIALASFFRLMNANVQFYSLQKDPGIADRKLLNDQQQIICLGDSLHDFTDTAAVIELMDLIISVDTSVAHLAAAMGKPVWILLAFSPDWRWLLDREDSPWYSSARLFRQSRIGDWEDVFVKLKLALENFIHPASQP